jgi:hypothetical protein
MQRKGRNPRGTLREDDRWQSYQLSGGARKELDFWLR